MKKALFSGLLVLLGAALTGCTGYCNKSAPYHGAAAYQSGHSAKLGRHSRY